MQYVAAKAREKEKKYQQLINTAETTRLHSTIITGPPNGPVLFCSLASVVVCNAAGGQVGRPPGSCGGGVADTARRASTVTSR